MSKKLSLREFSAKLKTTPAPRKADGTLNWGFVDDGGTPHYTRAFKRHVHTLKQGMEQGTDKTRQKAAELYAARVNEVRFSQKKQVKPLELKLKPNKPNHGKPGTIGHLRHGEDPFTSVFSLSGGQRQAFRRNEELKANPNSGYGRSQLGFPAETAAALRKATETRKHAQDVYERALADGKSDKLIARYKSRYVAAVEAENKANEADKAAKAAAGYKGYSR